MLDKNSSLPLYVLVKEYILKLILSGEYPPKSQLPTEHELMKTLGVGRATVRSALAQLENEGTIIKKHGVGTFVAERSRTFGFEPFISLSFMLDKMGIKSTNNIPVEHECLTISESDGFLSSHWKPGTIIYHVKRIRFAENYPIAIEDSYFTPALFEKFKDVDFSDSIAHALLSNSDQMVEKISSEMIVRTPEEWEAKNLLTKSDAKLLELTRWMCFEGEEEPSNFVKFVIPMNVLEFPFLR